MKKIFTHPIIIYIVSFTIVFAYVIYFKTETFNTEWLWGIAVFSIPVMFPVAFIAEAISILMEN